MCVCVCVCSIACANACIWTSVDASQNPGTPWRPRRCERGWVAASRRRFGGRRAGQRLANGWLHTHTHTDSYTHRDSGWFVHEYFGTISGEMQHPAKDVVERYPGLAMQWIVVVSAIFYLQAWEELSSPMISDLKWLGYLSNYFHQSDSQRFLDMFVEIGT